jgi:hypothetical protein
MKSLKYILSTAFLCTSLYAQEPSINTGIKTNNFLPLRFIEPAPVQYNPAVTNNFLPLRFVATKEVLESKFVSTPNISIKEKCIGYAGSR